MRDHKGEDNMAGRSGPTTINININDGEEIYDLLGRGLHAVRQIKPRTKDLIEVNPGGGLAFDSKDALVVNPGLGLHIDENGKVAVGLGYGLGFDENGQIEVTAKYSDVIGDGLTLDSNDLVVVDTHRGVEIQDGKVGINVGDGLTLDVADRLAINPGDGIEVVGGKVTAPKTVLGDGLKYDGEGRLVIDNSMSGPGNSFESVSDITFSFEMGVLSLNKSITTYQIDKNKVGNVVGVNPVATRVETEKVTIGGGPYNYGTAMHSVPERKECEKMPIFYRNK